MTGRGLPQDFPGGRLRRLRPTDLEALQAYRSIPELGRYQGWSAMTDVEAADFLAEMAEAALFVPGAWVQIGIADTVMDRLIGDIGAYLSGDGRTGEIGFTLEPSAQGRGCATRAVRAALGLMFDRTSVERILGVTDERNAPSIRLLERLGFVHVESRQVVFREEPCTERVYALSRASLPTR